MELTITKEKVLEAASKCEAAKETLKVLFPEVFNQKVPLDMRHQITDFGTGDWVIGYSGSNRSLFINPAYEVICEGHYLSFTRK